MPRRPDEKVVSDYVPGLRRYLVEREERDWAQPDPRVYLSPDPEAELVAAIQPPYRMLADLLAGRPVTIPAWTLRGRRFGEATSRIPWLRNATDVVVHADDSITAA